MLEINWKFFMSSVLLSIKISTLRWHTTHVKLPRSKKMLQIGVSTLHVIQATRETPAMCLIENNCTSGFWYTLHLKVVTCWKVVASWRKEKCFLARYQLWWRLSYSRLELRFIVSQHSYAHRLRSNGCLQNMES